MFLLRGFPLENKPFLLAVRLFFPLVFNVFSGGAGVSGSPLDWMACDNECIATSRLPVPRPQVRPGRSQPRPVTGARVARVSAGHLAYQEAALLPAPDRARRCREAMRVVRQRRSERSPPAVGAFLAHELMDGIISQLGGTFSSGGGGGHDGRGVLSGGARRQLKTGASLAIQHLTDVTFCILL